jgi:orotate phosphoribosyltransferase
VEAFYYLIGAIKSTISCFGQLTGEQQKRMTGMKKELIRLLCEKSFRYTAEPTFKLVSGRMSRFYVNCKPTTLSPRGMFLVGNLVFEQVQGLNVRGVGGLTFGADPIAVAAAYTSELKKQPLQAFSIRKDRKDHGVIRWVEGDLEPGDRVAIIDDVATTGGSTIKAIERATSEGLVVVKAVILVDRQEGGVENIRRHVPDVSAIVTRDELVTHWKQIKK